MENSDYKEKRKHEVAAKPRYVVLKILTVITAILSSMLITQHLPFYPLKIIPMYLAYGVGMLLIAGYGLGFVVFICLLFGLVWHERRGHNNWQRVSYLIWNFGMAGLGILFCFMNLWGGFIHEDTISLNNHTYHLVSKENVDIDTSYHYTLMVCDITGIVCYEAETASLYFEPFQPFEIPNVNLRISNNARSVEVMATNNNTTEIFFTYTPEIAEAE